MELKTKIIKIIRFQRSISDFKDQFDKSDLISLTNNETSFMGNKDKEVKNEMFPFIPDVSIQLRCSDIINNNLKSQQKIHTYYGF